MLPGFLSRLEFPLAQLRPFLMLVFSLLEGLQYSQEQEVPLGISNPGNTKFYKVKEIKVISELLSVNY